MVANWTSIPSDVPSPARALLIQVNGVYNYGDTTLTNSICIPSVMAAYRSPKPLVKVRILGGMPNFRKRGRARFIATVLKTVESEMAP